MSDSELLLFVADGLRPSLMEHSLLTARLYGIAKRLQNKTDQSPPIESITPKRPNPFTVIEGGRTQQVPSEE